jgi:hypothetical protein
MYKKVEDKFPFARCSQSCAECERGDDPLCTNTHECQCTHIMRFPPGWASDAHYTTAGLRPPPARKRRFSRTQEPIIEQYTLSFAQADPIPRNEPDGMRIPNKSTKRGRRRKSGFAIVIVAL